MNPFSKDDIESNMMHTNSYEITEKFLKMTFVGE